MDDNCELRILTYNIRHGEGMDGCLDLPRLARVIVAQAPDLVALQEVDHSARRSGGVDQAAELGRLTGLHTTYGKSMDFQGGAYGVAVLSRWPFAGTETWPLPGLPGGEPRVALATRVRPVPAGPEVAFVCTHLHYGPETEVRTAQAKAIAARVQAAAGAAPAILAGDLNSVPGSEPLQTLAAGWHECGGATLPPTYPADVPLVRIDYVLCRPAARWECVACRVLDEAVASDHRPALATLRLVV